MSNDERFSRIPRYQPSGLSWPFAFLLVLAAFGIWWFSLSSRGGQLHDPTATPRPVAPRGDLGADEQSTIEIFQRVSPSVVNIIAVGVVRNSLESDPHYFRQGVGSGFVWSEAGYIVTNYHVIEKASGAVVTLADGTELGAKLVGFAPDQDLAVLKVEANPEKLKPITVGTSADLQVGQKVMVIGNPFGFDQSLSTGTIGGLGRSMRARNERLISDVIQTDAAINPGNSGGPLLDSAGRLIGVTTAIYSPSGASAGIGFAIPVDTVNHVVPMLIKHGKVDRPILGVNVGRVKPQVSLNVYGTEGVWVFPDEQGGTSTQIGLKPTYNDPQTRRMVFGDLIIAVEGQRVKNILDLMDVLSTRQVGEEVTVTVIRDNREVPVKVTLRGIPQR